MNKTHLYIDLEETVIYSWWNPKCLHENIRKIKTFAIENNISSCTVYSMAIFDQEESQNFYNSILPLFHNELDLEVNVITLEEVFDLIVKNTSIHGKISEWSDIFLFNGKQDSFIQYIKAMKTENQTYVLFDDVVDNLTMVFEDTNTKIQFRKV